MKEEAESVPEEKQKKPVSLGAPSISTAIWQLSSNSNYEEMSDKQIQYQLHKGVADQVDLGDAFASLQKESSNES
jgi:hypothetical protein